MHLRDISRKLKIFIRTKIMTETLQSLDNQLCATKIGVEALIVI